MGGTILAASRALASCLLCGERNCMRRRFNRGRGAGEAVGRGARRGVGAVCDVRNTKTADAPQFATGSLSTILRRHEAETAVPGHRLGVVGEVPIGKSLDEPNLIQALAKIVNGRVHRSQAAAARRLTLTSVGSEASQGIAFKRDVVRSWSAMMRSWGAFSRPICSDQLGDAAGHGMLCFREGCSLQGSGRMQLVSWLKCAGCPNQQQETLRN